MHKPIGGVLLFACAAQRSEGRSSPLHLAKRAPLIWACCLLVACASSPALPRLNEDARNSLGTVGVITVGPSLGGDVEGPVGVGREAVVGVFKGAAIGTGSGVVVGVGVAALACGPGALFCGAVLLLGGAAIGLVGGGIAGGVSGGRNAIPAETAEQIETALNQAIGGRDLQADLRQGILRHAGNNTMAVDLGAGVTEPVASPDYTSMAERGIGAVLEISVTQLTFTGEGGNDPALALVISARGRLIQVSDRQVLWNVAEVRYQTGEAALSLWTASDSSLLEMEIDKGSDDLARQMGEALFGVTSMMADAKLSTRLLTYRTE